MVMTGTTPLNPNALERVTFYNFQRDSWRRKLDVSYDGGESWIENVALVEAKRVCNA